MRNTKRLKSVIHSIAHHAVSGLCLVHPHLGRARKALGVLHMSVDLLHPKVEPAPDPLPPEIERGADALRQTFADILASESLSIGDLTSAVATFVYKGQCTWPEACAIQVETITGHKIQDAVGDDGKRAEIILNKME